jgi:hypothetical protein
MISEFRESISAFNRLLWTWSDPGARLEPYEWF